MHYLELIFIGIVLLYPLVDYFNAKHKSSHKTVEYLKISGSLWGLTLFLAYLYHSDTLSVQHFNFFPQFNWQNITAGILLLVAIIYLIMLIKSVTAHEKLRTEVADKFRPYMEVMPTSKKEMLIFVFVVSVTAGICEELIFRAYFFNLLDASIGVVGAILCSSLIFGLWHIYLGWQEVLRTSITGAVLCLVYILTDNIVVPIILHIFVDIYSGLLCYFSLKGQTVVSKSSQ